MFGLDPLTLGVVAGYSALLTIAAVTDVAKRRIPNWTVIGLVALFVLWVVAKPGLSLSGALAAFSIALFVSAALYLMRWVGAGDSKLFAALALFAGLRLLPSLSLATVIIGGLIVVVMTFVRPRQAARGLTAEGRAQSRGVPYGVAIALAGLLIMFAPSVGLLQARDEFGLLPAGALAPVKR